MGENNNPTVLEENNNSVSPEGRHKLPPLVIRGPRVEVARRVSGLSRGLSRGPRKSRSQQIKTVARVVTDEAVRAVLGEEHGSGNNPQVEGEEEPSRDPTTSQLATIPEQHHTAQ